MKLEAKLVLSGSRERQTETKATMKGLEGTAAQKTQDTGLEEVESWCVWQSCTQRNRSSGLMGPLRLTSRPPGTKSPFVQCSTSWNSRIGRSGLKEEMRAVLWSVSCIPCSVWMNALGSLYVMNVISRVYPCHLLDNQWQEQPWWNLRMKYMKGGWWRTETPHP